MLYHFADCTLDTARHTLHRAGQDIRLSRKVFEVLCYLLVHRDQVVSKQELCDRIWEGVAISDATLESCIRAVRASIGDTGQKQGIIQTQRGYGYQCVVEVREEHDTSLELLPVPPMPSVAGLPPTEPVQGSAAQALSGVYLCFTCQHANRHDATFCSACGTRLRQSCSACGQSSPIPAAFCTACGHPFVAAVLSGTVRLDATLGSSGERKSITVLCCAVNMVTGSGERVDLDTRHSVIQKLHDLSQDVIRRYGGRLHPTMDERLLIMFGVPVAQEDDARRAVRVALELRQRLQAPQEHGEFPDGTTLRLRIGLHTGWVVIGGRRDDTETVATVVGDVMSVAMALQEQALPDSILCSDATARLIQGAVHLGEGRALPVPGQSLPLMAYPVLAEDTWRPLDRLHSGRTLSPFVGRGREMATLHDLLAQVEAGRGQVVGIVGEAGIGKSRLVHEFRQSLKDRSVTYRAGRCLSYGNTTPYLPLLELLRQNCRITEADRPEDIRAKVEKSLRDVQMDAQEWAPGLLHLLGVHEGAHAFGLLSPETRKARTMAALTQLCLQGSRQRPLILEMEDLHWIDASSDEYLSALIERMAGARLLLLVTYRPGHRPAWIDRSYATQISLHPLAPSESLQVVQTILPTASLPTPLVPRLLAKADGNPFFLEELARTVVEQGGEVSATMVPDTVQAVLAARIDRLPASAKSVLQAAAVIGKDIDLRLLQAITNVSAVVLQRDLTGLQTAEFLYEAQTTHVPVYLFQHALTQEVAYQSLLRSKRQQYHANIAQVLEAQFPAVAETQPELLAQHYTQADQGQLAIPYWQRAGQRAVERLANVEAISHFTEGLVLLQAQPQTPDCVQQELAFQLAIGAPLLMLKGHTAPEVERTYNRAYALAQQLGETPQRFAVLIGLWRFYFNQAKLSRARELAEQCFTLACYLQDKQCLQEAHTALGSTLLHLGEHSAARAALEQGIALYDRQHSRLLAFSRGLDPGIMCLSRLAWILWMLGYEEQAVRQSREALALAQEMAHPYSQVFAYHFAGLLHQCRRDVPSVIEQAAGEMALSHVHGFVEWEEGSMMLHGWALAQQGATTEGIALLHQGLDAWLARGNDLGKTQVLARLAECYGHAGQSAEGLRVLEQALDTVRSNGERHYETEIYRLKGELLLQSAGQGGEHKDSPALIAEADACFRQALDIARHQQVKSLELRAAMSLTRLWQGQEQHGEALQSLTEIYNRFTEGFDTLDLQEAKALLAMP